MQIEEIGSILAAKPYCII